MSSIYPLHDAAVSRHQEYLDQAKAELKVLLDKQEKESDVAEESASVTTARSMGDDKAPDDKAPDVGATAGSMDAASGAVSPPDLKAREHIDGPDSPTPKRLKQSGEQ